MNVPEPTAHLRVGGTTMPGLPPSEVDPATDLTAGRPDSHTDPTADGPDPHACATGELDLHTDPTAADLDPLTYPTARGVESAIKQAAVRAHAARRAAPVADLIRQVHFDRFLCRVFSEGSESRWALKGGTGLLARVPDGRATLDVDLLHSAAARLPADLAEAEADLRRLAAVDLGDHFHFTHRSSAPILAGGAQPYTQGRRVTFETHIGAKKASPVGVDLVVAGALTAPVDVRAPANRLELPRLATFDYRLYPVTDQIADKVWATMDTYAAGPSTREKDLVDLVVLAVTHDVAARPLRLALEVERRRRRIEAVDRFAVPARWGPAYARMARAVPACAAHPDVAAARDLMARFLDPLLDSDDRLPEPAEWDHRTLAWRRTAGW